MDELYIQLYVDRTANEWKVRIVNNHGEVLFTSKGFDEDRDCYSLIERLKKQIGDAPVSEIGTL